MLQRINSLARNLGFTKTCRTRRLNVLRSLISDNCTFVASWDDPKISDEVLRVFPRKQEAAEAVVKFLQKKRLSALAKGAAYHKVRSLDMMVSMESHADWRNADSRVINMLDHQCREP